MSSFQLSFPIQCDKVSRVRITTGFAVPYGQGSQEFNDVRAAIKEAFNSWKAIGRTGVYERDADRFIKSRGFMKFFPSITLHPGVDLNVDPGNADNSAESTIPLVAITDGLVESAGFAPFTTRNPIGGYVYISHSIGNQIFYTNYWHLSNNLLVRTGEKVVAGQPIGYIAGPSLCSPSKMVPHLHFEIRTKKVGQFLWSPISNRTVVFDAIKYTYDFFLTLSSAESGNALYQLSAADVLYYSLDRKDFLYSPGIDFNRYITAISVGRQNSNLKPSTGASILSNSYTDPIKFMQKLKDSCNSTKTLCRNLTSAGDKIQFYL